MLPVSRLLVRDRRSRALLLVVDAVETPLRVEAADGGLTVETEEGGRPVVDAPVVALEILNDEAMQLVGPARLQGERELRDVRLIFELPQTRAQAVRQARRH